MCSHGVRYSRQPRYRITSCEKASFTTQVLGVHANGRRMHDDQKSLSVSLFLFLSCIKVAQRLLLKEACAEQTIR